MGVGWGGHIDEGVPLRAFFSFFGSFSACTAYLKSAHKNVFRWWVFSFGVDLPRGQIYPFMTTKLFQWAANVIT